MSYCTKEGKDRLIFVTEEDHKKPSTVTFPEEKDDDKPVGPILPNGDVNWSCPCFGGMPTGPCGIDFRDAFSCYHYSTAEPQGSDCLEQFKSMSMCMSKFPGLYGSNDEDEDVFSEHSEEITADSKEHFSKNDSSVPDKNYSVSGKDDSSTQFNNSEDISNSKVVSAKS